MKTDSSLELLEDRIAPAGVVMVSLVHGNLILHGDNAGDSVELDPTNLVLKGLSGTVLKMGSGASVATLAIPHFTGGLTVLLGSGTNTVKIDTGTLHGNVSITEGGGTDSINLVGNTIDGSLTLAGKTGTETVALTGPQFMIHHNMMVEAGAGSRTLNATPGLFEVGGNFAVTAGNGTNVVNVSPTDVSIHGNTSMVAGTGSDSFLFAASHDAKFGGSVAISMKGLNPVATVVASNLLSIAGSLSYAGGVTADTVTLSGISVIVGGNLTTKTGKSSVVVISTSNDLLLHGNVLVKGGTAAGGMTLVMDGSTTLEIGGSMTLSGSPGSDTFVVDAGVFDLRGNGLVSGGGVGAAGGDVAVFSVGAARFSKAFAVKNSGAATGTATFVLTAGPLLMEGDFSYAGGAEKDTVSMAASGTVLGRTSIKMGSGDGQNVTLTGTSTETLDLMGPVTITQGANTGTSTTLLKMLAVYGRLNVMTGAAADTVNLDDLTLQAASRISTGAGNDIFNFEATGTTGASSVDAPMTILLGSGDDKATIGGGNAGSRVIFNAASLLDAGAGDDTTSVLGNGNVFNAPLKVVNSEHAS